MEYTIKPHPTRYRDVEFRSRLEATWAAYFDLCQVRWEYEPLDLQGWVPDFVLHHGSHEVLVEVKPSFDPSEDRSGYEKAVAHCNTAWVLLLGREPKLVMAGLLFDYPRTDGSEGDAWIDFHNRISPANTLDLWKKASNLTRWKGPRS